MKICSDSVHHAIDDSLAHIQMTPEQKQAILAQCRSTLTVQRPRHIVFKRVLTAAAAVALCAVCGLGVLANSPALAQRLGMLGQHTLTMLHPVEQVAVDKGIRMEVLAAMNDQDVAAVYLTLQDTAHQGRVTEDLELRHFQISGATFSSAEVIAYDDATQTATICMTGEGGLLANRKVSVTLRSFLNGWNYQELCGPEVSALDAMQQLGLKPAPLDTKAEINGYFCSSDLLPLPEEAQEDYSLIPVLKGTDSGPALPGADWAQITAVGQLDDALHIQLLRDDRLGVYNQVDFYLTDLQGQPLNTPQYVVELGDQTMIAPGWRESRRQEHILQLPAGMGPEDVQVQYGLSTYADLTEGVWSVAFALEDAGEALTIPCTLPKRGWSLQEVEISALGVTLRGSGSPDILDDVPNVTLILEDGTSANFFSSSVAQSEDRIVAKQLFRYPIDLSRIQQVLLDDIPLRLPEQP